MRKKYLFFFTLFLATTLLTSAEVPTMINYQGRVTNSEGEPINGDVSVTFAIYDAATDGSSKWTETHDLGS
jgi:hypothetical protein